jgi:hypothetical protein
MKTSSLFDAWAPPNSAFDARARNYGDGLLDTYVRVGRSERPAAASYWIQEGRAAAMTLAPRVLVARELCRYEQLQLQKPQGTKV